MTSKKFHTRWRLFWLRIAYTFRDPWLSEQNKELADKIEQLENE